MAAGVLLPTGYTQARALSTTKPTPPGAQLHSPSPAVGARFFVRILESEQNFPLFIGQFPQLTLHSPSPAVVAASYFHHTAAG
jgi:hypothetical protein